MAVNRFFRLTPQEYAPWYAPVPLEFLAGIGERHEAKYDKALADLGSAAGEVALEGGPQTKERANLINQQTDQKIADIMERMDRNEVTPDRAALEFKNYAGKLKRNPEVQDIVMDAKYGPAAFEQEFKDQTGVYHYYNQDGTIRQTKPGERFNMSWYQYTPTQDVPKAYQDFMKDMTPYLKDLGFDVSLEQTPEGLKYVRTEQGKRKVLSQTDIRDIVNSPPVKSYLLSQYKQEHPAIKYHAYKTFGGFDKYSEDQFIEDVVNYNSPKAMFEEDKQYSANIPDKLNQFGAQEDDFKTQFGPSQQHRVPFTDFQNKLGFPTLPVTPQPSGIPLGAPGIKTTPEPTKAELIKKQNTPISQALNFDEQLDFEALVEATNPSPDGSVAKNIINNWTKLPAETKQTVLSGIDLYQKEFHNKYYPSEIVLNDITSKSGEVKSGTERMNKQAFGSEFNGNLKNGAPADITKFWFMDPETGDVISGKKFYEDVLEDEVGTDKNAFLNVAGFLTPENNLAIIAKEKEEDRDKMSKFISTEDNPISRVQLKKNNGDVKDYYMVQGSNLSLAKDYPLHNSNLFNSAKFSPTAAKGKFVLYPSKFDVRVSSKKDLSSGSEVGMNVDLKTGKDAYHRITVTPAAQAGSTGYEVLPEATQYALLDLLSNSTNKALAQQAKSEKVKLASALFDVELPQIKTQAELDNALTQLDEFFHSMFTVNKQSINKDSFK